MKNLNHLNATNNNNNNNKENPQIFRDLLIQTETQPIQIRMSIENFNQNIFKIEK